MAVTDIDWGTVTLTNGETTVTGVGTSFLADELADGDTFVFVDGADGFQSPIVESVQSNTELTLRQPWAGPTLTAATYTLRYQWNSSRVSAMSRRLIMLLDNGNLTAFSQLTGPGVAVFNGPHSMEVRPFSDFVNGARFDVQVDELDDRDAYDGQTQGFAVLVSDVGDGRSAVYSKASNSSGDWTAPAYVTGPAGPAPTLGAGTTTRGPLDAEIVPVGTGYELNLTLPVNAAQGDYSGATAYLTGDIVQSAGSSWVALQNTTGNAPPSLPTTSNAYWQLLARAGNDGAGTVTTVVGDSGIDVDSTDPTMPVVSLAPVPTVTIKGRVAAGTGAPTDLTGTQVNTILPLFGTAKGLVPGRTSAMGLFLRDDGTWQPAGSQDLEFTVAQIMMRLADIDNVAQFLGPSGNRFADSYDTLTYVDVAGSTNLNTSTQGVLSASFSDVRISTGSGFVGLGSGNPVNINDNNPSTTISWSGSNLVGVPDINRVLARIDYGSNVALSKIEAVGFSQSAGSAGYALYTSTDGSNYTKQGSDIVGSSTPTTTSRSGNFVARYIAVIITAVDFSTVNVALGDLNGYVSVNNNLTVSSTSFSALSAPTKMKSLLNVREIEVAAAGTDYFIDVSRDGGTTWSAMTLTERYSLPSGLRVVEGAEIDVSGQPSGTAPRYRLRTANNKNVEFHDTYLYWI